MTPTIGHNKLKPNGSQEKLCVCKIMHHMILICKLFGIIPATTHHMHGVCIFNLSRKWIAYSILLIAIVTAQIAYSMDIRKFAKFKHITILLNDITDIMYSALVIVLNLCNIIRSARSVKYLNLASKVMKEVNLCTSVGQLTIKVGWSIIGMGATMISVQFIALGYMNFSEQYQSNFDLNLFINRAIQNYIVVFVISILCAINIVIGSLACFEKLTRSCLKYSPVHPLKTIVETNNVRNFLGFFKYEICKENHPVPAKLSKLMPAEQVEYLRQLHEDICLAVYEYNSCLSPQLLCTIVTLLIVLIVQLYSVIIYLGFDISTPETCTIHVMNCITVTFTSMGLFFLFKNMQHYKNMVSLLNFRFM